MPWEGGRQLTSASLLMMLKYLSFCSTAFRDSHRSLLYNFLLCPPVALIWHCPWGLRYPGFQGNIYILLCEISVPPPKNTHISTTFIENNLLGRKVMYKGGAAALVMPDPSCSLKLQDELSKLWYAHIMDY